MDIYAKVMIVKLVQRDKQDKKSFCIEYTSEDTG